MNTEEKIVGNLEKFKELVLINTVYGTRHSRIMERLMHKQAEMVERSSYIRANAPNSLPVIKSLWEAIVDVLEVDKLMLLNFADLAESGIELSNILLEHEKGHE